MVRPTMMNTIMVVSQVSFQLGQVTLLISRRTSVKNCIGETRRRATGASASVSVTVFFVTSAISTLQQWQERGDSNPRPSVLETDALPAELHSCVVSGPFPRFAGRPFATIPITSFHRHRFVWSKAAWG